MFFFQNFPPVKNLREVPFIVNESKRVHKANYVLSFSKLISEKLVSDVAIGIKAVCV